MAGRGYLLGNSHFVLIWAMFPGFGVSFIWFSYLLPALEGDKTTIKAQVEEGGIRMRAGRGSWMDGHMGGQGRWFSRRGALAWALRVGRNWQVSTWVCSQRALAELCARVSMVCVCFRLVCRQQANPSNPATHCHAPLGACIRPRSLTCRSVLQFAAKRCPSLATGNCQ